MSNHESNNDVNNVIMDTVDNNFAFRFEKDDGVMMCQNEKSNEVNDGDSPWPVLFLQGLPKDFSNDTQLAAIACLMEDDLREEKITVEEDNCLYIKGGQLGPSIADKKKIVDRCVGTRYPKNKQNLQPRQEQHQQHQNLPLPTIGGGKCKRSDVMPPRKHRTTAQSPYPTATRNLLSGTIPYSSKPTPSVAETTLFLNLWNL